MVEGEYDTRNWMRRRFGRKWWQKITAIKAATWEINRKDNDDEGCEVGHRWSLLTPPKTEKWWRLPVNPRT